MGWSNQYTNCIVLFHRTGSRTLLLTPQIFLNLWCFFTVYIFEEYDSVNYVLIHHAQTNINYARSEILVLCLVYIDQLLFLNKLFIFFNKVYYRESFTGILIIEHSSVVTVAKWLDGSLKVKVDSKKPSSGSIPESPKLCISRFLSQKQLKVKSILSTILLKNFNYP